MNIVIIEDEVQTAWDLQQSIEKLRPDFVVKDGTGQCGIRATTGFQKILNLI